MKISVKILLFICLIFNITKVYVEDINEYSNKSNIEKTILIEKYLTDHKLKIKNFAKKYNMENDSDLVENLNKIDYLISSLNKIQINNIWYDNEKIAINTILNEIKKINEELKNLLKKKKELFDQWIKKKVDFYAELWIRISTRLDEINIKLKLSKLKEKQILTIKESKLKNSLIKLENISRKLKRFENIKFNSEEEVKTSFIRILKELRTEIKELKKNLK